MQDEIIYVFKRGVGWVAHYKDPVAESYFNNLTATEMHAFTIRVGNAIMVRYPRAIAYMDGV